MKVACIDTGTNSIRLMLGEYIDGRFQDVQKKLAMTRLGKGVNETGMLDQMRMDESVKVIKEYYEDAGLYGADRIYIMATSAVRDSRNADEFKRMIMEATGLELEIISGMLEAEVGFAGVLNGSDAPEEKSLVIDIGGGSTELIVGNQSGIEFSKSLNIGAVRLTGALIHHDPVLLEEREAIQKAVEAQAREAISQIRTMEIKKVIGIGGTATTIATMHHKVKSYSRDAVHRLAVTLNELMAINATLAYKTVEERKGLIGLEEKRADIIFAGGIILQTLLELLEYNTFEVSDFDNLEGFAVYKINLENKK